MGGRGGGGNSVRVPGYELLTLEHLSCAVQIRLVFGAVESLM